MIKEEIILKSIERKLGIIGNCQMNEDEIQKSFTKDEINLIEKSKYIRREGVKGNYKYVYDEPNESLYQAGQKAVANISNSKISDKIKNSKVVNNPDGEGFVLKHGDYYISESDTVVSTKNALKFNSEEEANSFKIGEKKEQQPEKKEEVDYSSLSVDQLNKVKSDLVSSMKQFSGNKVDEKALKSLGDQINKVNKVLQLKDQQPEKKDGLKVKKGPNGFKLDLGKKGSYHSFVGETKEEFIERMNNKGYKVQKSLDTPEYQVAQIMKSIKEGQLKDEQGNTITDITKAFEIVVHDDIEKSQKANVGDIHIWNGKKFKKQPNGKWLEVSDNGMTKKEHKDKQKEHQDKIKAGENLRTYQEVARRFDSGEAGKHAGFSSKLSDKEHTDEEVGLGGYKNGDRFEYNGHTIHVGLDTSGGQSTTIYKAPTVSDKTFWGLDKLKELINKK